MMEQKINEENIENNLVFCIGSRKAFAIKSIPKSVFFLNPSHKNKIVCFLFRLNFDFGFFIKQFRNRLYLVRKKDWIYIAVSEAVCLLNSTLLEKSDDLFNKNSRTVDTPGPCFTRVHVVTDEICESIF